MQPAVAHHARRLVGRKILASGAGHIQRPLVAARVDGDNQLMLPHVDDMSRVDVSGWTTFSVLPSSGLDIGKFCDLG